MQQLNFNISENKINLLNKEYITSGSCNTVKCKFKFSENWKDRNKIAVFIMNGIAKNTALINDECYMPRESLIKKGDLFVGVYSTKICTDGTIDSIYTTDYESIAINEGSFEVGGETQPQTPTDYQRYMEVINNLVNQTKGYKDDTLLARDVTVNASKGFDTNAITKTNEFNVNYSSKKAIIDDIALQVNNNKVITDENVVKTNTKATEVQNNTVQVSTDKNIILQAKQDIMNNTASERKTSDDKYSTKVELDNMLALNVIEENKKLVSKADKTGLEQSNNRIKELEDNQIISNFEGESVMLKDSSNNSLKKLSILGRSVQERRDGYNLVNLNAESYAKDGVTVTKNNDGSYTLNGTSTNEINLYLTTLEGVGNNIYAFETVTYTLSTFVTGGTVSALNNTLLHVAAIGKINGVNSFGIMLNTISNNQFSQTKIPSENSILSAVIFFVGGAGVVFNNYTIKIQLNKGNAKTYEQYGVSPSPDYPSEIKSVVNNVNLKITGYEDTKKQTQQIILNDSLCSLHPTVCDVIDYGNNSITRRIGKILLNGTEIWGYGNENATTVRFYKPKDSNIKSMIGLCDKFKHVNSLGATLEKEGFSLTTVEGIIYININKTRLKGFTDSMQPNEKVNLFKLFLASNNVTVQYEIAIPEIEKIEILDKKNLYTYKTVTNITTDSVVKSILKGEYVVHNQTYVDNKLANLKQEILSEVVKNTPANVQKSAINEQYNEILKTGGV
ncbi:MAG: hypothetical protein RSG48_03705 [Clostridia bacterium]